jgi:hypothetical protein
VVQQIVTKTDGVPLFVEELTKMVLESGLVRAVNGHYELTGPLPLLAIPSTLQLSFCKVSCEREMGFDPLRTPAVHGRPLKGPRQGLPEGLPQHRPTGFADSRQLRGGPLTRTALLQLGHE